MTALRRTGSMDDDIRAALAAAATVQQLILDHNVDAASRLAALILQVLERGGTVFWIGNGGSAAQAQHAAAELMGRFLRDRRPLSSLSLTVDTSALTAIANDYGYDQVFARQLRGLGKSGDLLIALSTSGTSSNVLHAVDTARELGMETASLTGERGGALAERCDLVVRIPSDHTARIQEGHLAIIHAVCGAVEDRLGKTQP